MKPNNRLTEFAFSALQYPKSRPVLLALSALLLGGATLKATEADDRIEASAKTTFVYRTFLSGDAIKVESVDGAVTLTGTVTEGWHKMLAAETLTFMSGVKSVNNQLIVKDSPDERSDTWLHIKVKSALALHRSVNVFKTVVAVKDGVVTLSGEAASQGQRDLTAEYAKDVEGVKAVKNEMTVAKTAVNGVAGTPEQTIAEIIDDASITAQVRMSLWTHRSTSALKTSVVTRDGNVTLSGMATNTAEIDLATKLVNDINGVKSVVNGMSVAPVATSK